MRILLSLLIVLISFEANACPKGYELYAGDCLEEKDVPTTPRQQLEYFGSVANKTGDVADLFAPDVHLLEKADANSKTTYSWKNGNADIESTAKIEKILTDWYYVTVTIYDGPTSCGMSAKVKKTLHGYVPKTNSHNLPSLWKYTHMSGIC